MELVQLAENMEDKLKDGFPLISAKTIIKNRYSELKEEVSEFLTDPNIDVNVKFQRMVDLNENFLFLKKKLYEYDLSLDELNQSIWEKVHKILLRNRILEGANKVFHLSEWVGKILVREFDPTVLEDISPLTKPGQWLETVEKILQYGQFNLQILNQAPFLENSQFERILGLCMYYYKTLDSLFTDDSFANVIADQNFEPFLDKFLQLFYQIYGSLIVGISVLMDKFQIERYETYLAYWEGEVLYYKFPVSLIDRFYNLKSKYIQKLRESNLATIAREQVVMGTHSSIKHLEQAIQYIAKACQLFEHIEELQNPSSIKDQLKHKMETILSQIEHELTGDFTPKEIEHEDARFMLLHSYIIAHAVLLNSFPFEYDDHIAKLEWASRFFPKETILPSHFQYIFATPIVMVNFALKKGNLDTVQLAVKKLKELKPVEATLAPYVELSYKFLLNVLQMVLNKKTLNEVIQENAQIVLQNSAFIPSRSLMELVETYLDYLRSYETSINENLQKPFLPLELEAMNTGFGYNHLLKVVPHFDFYSIKGDFIEMKYPLFGDMAFTIY